MAPRSMDREESLIFQFDRLRGCWREEVSEALVRQAREDAIALWPNGAPGALGNAPTDIPLLYPVLPAPAKATGAAVIVCPGGGFRSHVPWEAFPFAEWFSEQGVAGFVLQYRLLPYVMPAMLDDGIQAVRLVRSRAAEFGIDPGRIGMIGFSAGGYVTAMVSTHSNQGDPGAADPVQRASSRPDAAMLFYPVVDIHTLPRLARSLLNDPDPDPALTRRYSASLNVSRDTPSAFIYGLQTDQMVPYQQIMAYAEACEQHNVSFELHLYSYGLHGAGVASADPRLNWQASLANWLDTRGFLKDDWVGQTVNNG
jgi:acetyl esterase/lipase